MSSHHFLILDLTTAKVLFAYIGGWRRESANISTMAWG